MHRPELSVEEPHDEVVLPSTFDEGRLALATLIDEAAFAVRRDGARVRGQHTHRHPMQAGCEPEAERQAQGLGAEAATQTGRVFNADRQPGAPVMGINIVEAHVPYKALRVDHPSIGLGGQRCDSLFSMLPREGLRRIEAPAISSNDFGMPPDGKPRLDVAGNGPAPMLLGIPWSGRRCRPHAELRRIGIAVHLYEGVEKENGDGESDGLAKAGHPLLLSPAARSWVPSSSRACRQVAPEGQRQGRSIGVARTGGSRPTAGRCSRSTPSSKRDPNAQGEVHEPFKEKSHYAHQIPLAIGWRSDYSPT